MASVDGMTRGPLDLLILYVPADDTDTVLAALFAAGAGRLGDYAECAFVAPGTGQFRPLAGADPALGSVGDLEHVPENRVELAVPRAARTAVLDALRRAHPYEEPAFHLVETVTG